MIGHTPRAPAVYTRHMDKPIIDDGWALVGNTPMVRLARLSPAGHAEVCAKLESHNPSGSVKDRPARAMLLAAEKAGTLQPGAAIVEATSGNTGISLAMLAASRGYRCTVVMPQDMAQARHSILRGYGAEVVLTDAELGMRGAVEEAQRIVAVSGAFMPRQFDNPENPRSHELTTAEEIWTATGGRLDAVVLGVGTGGTLTGVARVIKKRLPKLRVVAVEPANSAVLSGGKPGLHAIQGLGAGFVPSVLDRSLIDEVITVTDLEAEHMVARLGREEGHLVGPSSGANVHAAIAVANTLGPDKRVVTMLCDNGDRYH